MMNRIHGTGYGDKHDWENKGTEQSDYPHRRSTLWVCRNCNVMFNHYYHNTPNIFQAIKEAGVKEECVKNE